jgi:hypothetical protein
MRGGVEVVDSRRILCPDCGGKGTVLEPDHPSVLLIGAVGDADRSARGGAFRRF